MRKLIWRLFVGGAKRLPQKVVKLICDCPIHLFNGNSASPFFQKMNLSLFDLKTIALVIATHGGSEAWPRKCAWGRRIAWIRIHHELEGNTRIMGVRWRTGGCSKEVIGASCAWAKWSFWGQKVANLFFWKKKGMAQLPLKRWFGQLYLFDEPRHQVLSWSVCMSSHMTS